MNFTVLMDIDATLMKENKDIVSTKKRSDEYEVIIKS